MTRKDFMINFHESMCQTRARLFEALVVQSIVSLTSSLRDQLVKCFIILFPNILIYFVVKIREACHNFSIKNIRIFELLTFEIFTKRKLRMSLVLNNWAQV